MADVLDGIAGTLKDDVLVISIAAGITTDAIRAKLGDVQIVRVMPNTPALVGAGASGLYNAGATRRRAESRHGYLCVGWQGDCG